ncbi:hypothetical protein HYDPIDRAFT_108981 [Hydnomerulius pinastri MD-312]|nr:hypothetical protein HYDPIDRAFT_108981 [Hydnomerulius pinastri MD-312]
MAPTPPRVPRLPIPDLRKTLDKYLQSIQPVLLADEDNGGSPFSKSYARQQGLVNAFLTGPGPLAQARLHALDKVSPHNWLNDNFWMKKTYLEWRAPLLINSNWWLTFVNDPDVPEEVVRDEGEGLTPWQVRRAACLVHGVVDFKHRMESEGLHPDTTRTGMWLRHSTSLIFNVSRVPRRDCDVLTNPAPPSSHWASTITVIAHDFYYALRVADPSSGAPLHVDEIERGLRAVVRDVLRRRESGEKAAEVGVLSSDERDEWAENYTNLLSFSPQNARSFEAIHQSLFVLSLDHWPAPSIPADERVEKLPLTFEVDGHIPAAPPSPSSLPSPSTTTPPDLPAHQSSARSSPSALNRFFDKPLSLIVERTTRAGAMGEHAAVDALIPSVVCEWGVAGASGVSFRGGLSGVSFERDRPEGKEENNALEGLSEVPQSASWARLDFITSPSTQEAIERAKGRAEMLIANSDHEVFYFEEWGGEEVRRVSNNQPDPFVQLALQLAFFRIHGRPTPVYETALTRSFKHGRTETIRAFTRESYAFVRACAGWKGSSGEGNNPPPHLHPLLQSALQTHSSLTRAAMTGRGIDRHLLGLRCVLSDEWAWLDSAPGSSSSSSDISKNISSSTSSPASTLGVNAEVEANAKGSSELGLGAKVPLFEDDVFKRSQEWKLSTSGLSEGWWFRGTGFGSPYEDGYGINYLIGPHSIKFCVESKHSCPTTSTRVFVTHIVDALRDLRDICLWAKKAADDGSSSPSGSETSAMEGAGDGASGAGRNKSGLNEGAVVAKARL